MTTNADWEGIEVLIPRRFHDTRRAVVASARVDHIALIEALPVTPSAIPGFATASSLADAGLEACRAWIASVVRALPTRTDMEASYDG